MQRLGIYIHWPYCLSKCPYCGFLSRVENNFSQDEVVASYLEDLAYYRQLNDDYKVETVFFGGGTPSLLKPHNVERLIGQIRRLWPCADDCEITLEANPNTDDGNIFANLRQSGVNRLSLGVQALNERDLRFLGRTHNLAQAMRSIESVQKNFDNHSIDLIYARPQQTADDWQKELQQACSLGLRHLSLYQLTIEPQTPFFRRGIKAMEDEKAGKLYELSNQIIAEYGYHRYEISNYADKGGECRHNLGYWQGYDYIGIGNGGIGRIHIKNDLYHTCYPRRNEKITAEERAEELLIMGLRINEGISKTRFKQQAGIELSQIIDDDCLNDFKQSGLLIEDENSLRATSKGFLLLDYLIAHLIKN